MARRLGRRFTCRLRSPPASRAARRRFQSSLSSTPILIPAALVAIYLILGMLYESTIHPLTIISTANRFAEGQDA